MSSRIRFATALLLSVSLGACDGSSTADPVEISPGLMRFQATAASTIDEFTISCDLDYILEVQGEVSRTPSSIEFIGTLGGEARRSVLRPDLSGFAIFADSFSDVQIIQMLSGNVEIRMINLPPPVPGVMSRFWDFQQLFEGTLLLQGEMSGGWTCAPLDTEINGIVDNVYLVDGDWSTTTIED